MSVERVTPADYAAEQSCLGAMLVSSDAAFHASDALKSEMFHWDSHRDIFNAANALVVGGCPVDVITLAGALRELGKFEDVGGGAYLTFLVDAVPSAANVVQYANTVREKWQRRTLIHAAAEAARAAYGDVDRVDEILSKIEDKVSELSSKQVNDLEHVSGIAKTCYDDITEMAAGRTAYRGIPTGYYELDRIIGGAMPGDLVIIAGQTSMGKTVAGLNIAYHAAHHCCKVGFFSLEMKTETVIARIISAECGIDSVAMRDGHVSEDDIIRIADSSERISSASLWIDSTSSMTPSEVRAKCLRHQRSHGLDMVVIDHLGFLHWHTRAENKNCELGEITRSLKAMAKDLDIPVVLLHQLSRAPSKRGSHRPVLADLRESGNVEQDADVVLFVYRPAYYNKPEPDIQTDAEIIVEKNRNGPTGIAHVQFERRYVRFVNKEYERKP